MVEDDADSKEIRETFRAAGWDGRCRLFAENRCNKGTCKKKGAGFVSPVTAPSPKMRPQGYRMADRQIGSCPSEAADRYRSAFLRWKDWRQFGTMPEPGVAGEQCSWTLQAISTLEAEFSLIELAQREERQNPGGHGG